MNLQQNLEFQVKQINPLELPRVLIPNRKELDQVSAIYFVISKTEKLIYLGQTEKLKKRWHKYECGIELDSPKQTSIAWIEIEEKNLRKFLLENTNHH